MGEGRASAGQRVPSPGWRSVIKDTLDPTACSGDAFQFYKSPNRSLFPRAILLAD